MELEPRCIRRRPISVALLNLLLHAVPRHRHVDASVVPSQLAREFHLARCSDRGTPQARSHTGTCKAVHGRPELAGDREGGLPRAALGDRDPSAGRNGGHNRASVDCPAMGVGGVAADCLCQPGKPAVVARRGARTGSRGARRSGRWTWKTDRAVPDRKPRACGTGRSCRTRARYARNAVS